jgi:hypothetical protein
MESTPELREVWSIEAPAVRGHDPDVGEEVFLVRKPKEQNPSDGASARASALSDLWAGRLVDRGSCGALSTGVTAGPRILQSLVAGVDRIAALRSRRPCRWPAPDAPQARTTRLGRRSLDQELTAKKRSEMLHPMHDNDVYY